MTVGTSESVYYYCLSGGLRPEPRSSSFKFASAGLGLGLRVQVRPGPASETQVECQGSVKDGGVPQCSLVTGAFKSVPVV
jgi:hypothetical protein